MLKILQKDNSVVGTDTYRDDSAGIANAYRMSLTHSINPNKEGSNNMVTVKTVAPVIVTVDGVSTSKDAFVHTSKFSALQQITADAQREAAFDNHIAYQIAAKRWILDGTLPDEPLVITIGAPLMALLKLNP